MVRCCYIRSWEGWGGVGHGSVMVRCCYVHGRGGVGWGMVASCSCYVAATLMRPLGYICYVAATFVLSALARFRSTLSCGLVAPSRAFLEAPWEKWKKKLHRCCVQAPDKTLSVHTIVYRMKTQKKRLTVSTCNFLRIANSLQIPVQNEHDAKCLRKHSTFAQFYMTTIWLYNENSPFYTKKCDFWLLRT